MSRADFYLIQSPRFREQPLLLVCALARKAYDAGQPALVLARDQAQAEALDDLMWSFEDEVYLPHQLFDGEEDFDDEEIPVLIATPDMDPPARTLVINLRDACAPGPFDRVLEVVPADPAMREPLRARWKEYQARGLSLQKHDM